jgi:hypothetical protein
MLKRREKTTAYLGYLAQIKIFPQKEIKHLLTWVIISVSGKLKAPVTSPATHEHCQDIL